MADEEATGPSSTTTGEPPAFQQEMDALIEGATGLFDNLKEVFLKSREEVFRASQLGRARIDVFQLRKDRERFLQRLGEEAYDLLVTGALVDVALEKAAMKIREIDGQIAEHEDQIARMADEQSRAAKEGQSREAKVEPVGNETAAVEKEAAPTKAAPQKVATKKATGSSGRQS